MLGKRTDLTFRFATVEDAHALAQIYATAVHDTINDKIPYQKLLSDRKIEFEQTIAKDGPLSGFEDGSHTLIAVKDDKPVGFLTYLYDHTPNRITVTDFYVLEREAKIGSALFDKFCKIQPEDIEIEVTATGSAQSAYERMGFLYENGDDMFLPADRMHLWRHHLGKGYPRFAAEGKKPDPGM